MLAEANASNFKLIVVTRIYLRVSIGCTCHPIIRHSRLNRVAEQLDAACFFELFHVVEELARERLARFANQLSHGNQVGSRVSFNQLDEITSIDDLFTPLS